MRQSVIRSIAIVTFVFAFISVRSSWAQEQRGPSTPDERARAVRIAHDLENDPLAKNADDQRSWVIKWIVEVPDITVNVCFDYFGALPDPPKNHSAEITNQMVISMAAYIIEHPDDAKNEQSIALAGLLGSIKAYQSILKQEPSSRWGQMDKLIAMREQGKLEDYVADTRRKCSQKEEEEPDPDTMRAQVFFPAVPNFGIFGK